MPHGGARVGSGRKRNEDPPNVGVGWTDTRLLRPPKDLSSEARKVWKRLAPHAVAELTLTASTAAGFRQLCVQWSYLQELENKIERRGAAHPVSSDALRAYLYLSQRLESNLGRFKLTAFGKPALSKTAVPTSRPANPFAQLRPVS